MSQEVPTVSMHLLKRAANRAFKDMDGASNDLFDMDSAPIDGRLAVSQT